MALVIENRMPGSAILPSPLQVGSVRIFAADGLPVNAIGSNNDLHIDQSGAKASFRPSVYQRQAGAWVAIA